MSNDKLFYISNGYMLHCGAGWCVVSKEKKGWAKLQRYHTNLILKKDGWFYDINKKGGRDGHLDNRFCHFIGNRPVCH